MNNPILITACISVAVGLICGVLVVWLIYIRRRHQEVDSLVRTNHVVGRFGTDEIPVNCSRYGLCPKTLLNNTQHPTPNN